MMWGSLLVGILSRPWAERVATIALAALTITLFLLNLRRIGERTGRAAEKLDQLERINAIQSQMLEVAAWRPRSRDDLLDRLGDGGFRDERRSGMSARCYIQQGVPGAGGRRIGTVA